MSDFPCVTFPCCFGSSLTENLEIWDSHKPFRFPYIAAGRISKYPCTRFEGRKF